MWKSLLSFFGITRRKQTRLIRPLSVRPPQQGRDSVPVELQKEESPTQKETADLPPEIRDFFLELVKPYEAANLQEFPPDDRVFLSFVFPCFPSK